MKPSRTSATIGLLLALGSAVCSSTPAEAQIKTTGLTPSYQVPYYLIQVEYAVPSSSYPRYYGYYGGYYQRYSFYWLTVAETTNLAEAEFIYELYMLAWELGVLDEVAPTQPRNAFPISVRMITEYRTVEPSFTLSTN